MARQIAARVSGPVAEQLDSLTQKMCRLAEDAEKAVQEVKDRYVPKPRMTARDDEVVRLREEGLGWKDVLKKVCHNPDWEKACKGKRLTAGALRAVYARRKKAARLGNT
jgi:hypothetical protein